ncbi:MAG: cytochrome P450 [Actinobacteria bacterium]|nr:cytochrome P450 [Actinomycetota bacterium]
MADLSLDQLEADPYPIYKELRNREPVAFVEALGFWMVTRWDDVVRVDRETDVFSAAIDHSTINRTLGPTMMHAEPEDHQRVRPAIADPLRPTALREVIFPAVIRIAKELMDGFSAEETVDLMDRFAEPLSVRVVALTLGLPKADEHRLRRWFDAFAAGGANFGKDPSVQQRADVAAAEFDHAMAAFVDEEAEAPIGSVLEHLLQLRSRGFQISREEILANLKLSVLGGMQEPRDLIGTTVYALLMHPDQMQEARRDPKLLQRSIEESLRWQSPVGTITRRVKRSVEISGFRLKEGDHVAGVIASANRDERHWTDPDRFDIHRREGGHLAFAVGSHTCVGAALARYVSRTAVSLLLQRWPTITLQPDGSATMHGWEFRGPTRLPVRLRSS